MKCVKCDDDMRKVMAHGIEIDQCPSCGGIWFDIGELDWLLDIPVLQIDKIESQLDDADDKPAPCPNCGGTGNMVRLVRVDSDFHIDACPTCSGRWLDGGELRELHKLERQQQLRKFLKSV